MINIVLFLSAHFCGLFSYKQKKQKNACPNFWSEW